MTPDQPSEPASTRGRWRVARLLDAPHRLCFFWAGVNWAAAAVWWAAHLLTDATYAPGRSWPWQVSPAAAHGLWFTLGAMPLFIAGFMFTAGPKWLRRPPVLARELRRPVAAFNVGWVVAVAGFHLSPTLAAAGLALVAAGWGALSWRITRLVSGSTQNDRLHAWLIVWASSLLVVCLGVASLALACGRPDWLSTVSRVALWGGVTLVFLAASHRLLPFLGAGTWPALDARWPDWPLWLVVSVPVVRGAGAAVSGWQLQTLPHGWRALEAGHLAAVATLCLWIALRCTRQRALRQPLVAMLFGAFMWWDVALWLGAAARWPGLATGTAQALDLAALHALTMGYLGGTMLVMVTRVSSTHSGRPQAMDRVARALYALLQVAVVMRLYGALEPTGSAMWLRWAGAAWLGVALVWAIRHGRWLGLPRVDGRPG